MGNKYQKLISGADPLTNSVQNMSYSGPSEIEKGDRHNSAAGITDYDLCMTYLLTSFQQLQNPFCSVNEPASTGVWFPDIHGRQPIYILPQT